MAPRHPSAEGFERATAAYERARPGYPRPIVEELATRLGVHDGAVVLELGAGTGKLTRELVARGATVLAVEPSAAMRRMLAEHAPVGHYGRIHVLGGTAEALPLPDARAAHTGAASSALRPQAAVAAQSFHWFEPAAAFAELHRVLPSAATLAIVFNGRDLTDPAQAALDALVAPYRGDTPSWADDSWRAALSDPPGFERSETIEHPHVQALDAAGLADRVGSISFVARLDAGVRGELEAATYDLASQLADDDGAVRLHYVTELHLFQRA